VKKAWLDIQEKKLTPQLEKKDKVDSYLAAKAHLEQKYRIERIKANEEGKKDGLRTGRREGRADSLNELNEKMAQAKQEGRAEAQI
jgi:flagellar biosynthesis/type III secretory pathway protein FliH